MKQSFSKLSKTSWFFIILILSLFAWIIYQNYFNHTLRQCPQAWYLHQTRDVITDPNTDPTSNQSFVIDGNQVDYDQVDVDWVIANCEGLQPQINY